MAGFAVKGDYWVLQEKHSKANVKIFVSKIFIMTDKNKGWITYVIICHKSKIKIDILINGLVLTLIKKIIKL